MKVALALVALALAFALGRYTSGLSKLQEAPDAVVVEEGNLLRERSPSAERAVDRPRSEETVRDEELVTADKDVSVADLVGESDPIRRTAVLAALLDSLTAENARETFEGLLGSAGTKHSDAEMHELRLVLRAWGRLDGKVAMEEAQALLVDKPVKEGEKRGKDGKKDKWGSGLLGVALEGWASKNLQAASAYVDTLEEKSVQVAYRGHLVDALLEKGPNQAMAYIQSLPEDDRSRARYVSMVTGHVLETGIDEAIAWMGSLPEDLRGGAISEIAAAYAREDLDGAIAWASENADDPKANKALAKVTGRWANMDPRAASEYLAELPASAGKDAAVEGFSTRLASEDPASAAVWATTIQNKRLRERTVARIAQSWARSDEAAARAWIHEQGLSDKAFKNVKQKPLKPRKAEKRR